MSKLETRFQYRSNQGIQWTRWMPWFGEKLSVKELANKYPWQEKNKLRNEFRKV